MSVKSEHPAAAAAASSSLSRLAAASHPHYAAVIAAAAASSGSAASSSVDRKKKYHDTKERVIFQEPPDDNTFRIMVSTDNHLGYLELDPIRKEDSFLSFREMLEAARANHVDFVLLGGDLFHENKPSRATLCKTVNIMREFAFGETPITFEIISDQAINFPTTKRCNYEDPNVNVALPIFSIHGNHDDPSGAGSYSTMDLLHSCSLLNYFGKIDRVDHIVNSPILMTKGNSKLALYGMGNVRDERLHRTFEMDGVRWDKPQSDPQTWFNLAVVHQNRTRHTVTQRDYLPEKFLPSWLDMVIWGHEHECMCEPCESVDGQYSVLQPGSSVATSLSGGEAVDKKVVIMEIQGDQYRTVPIPLYTTRPFIIADVRLADDLDPLDANPVQVEEYLSEKIAELIAKLKQDVRYSNPDRPELPLIRLRVEYTGFPRITNINKFGQKFVGRVANPEDLLLFSKQKKAPVRKAGAAGAKAEEEKQVDTFLQGDRDRPPPIHELVTILIRQQKGSLNVLTESRMAEMVDEYVNKKDLDSISNGVEKAIKSMTLAMKDDSTIKDRDGVGAADIERVIRKKHDEMTAQERKNHAKQEDEHKHIAEVFGINLEADLPMREATLSETEAMDGDGSDDDGASSSRAKSRKKPAAPGKAANGAAATKARKPAAKKSPSTKGKGRGRKKKVEDSDEESEEEKEEIQNSDDGEWKPRARRNNGDEDVDAETDASAIADEEEEARPSKKAKMKPSAAAAAATSSSSSSSSRMPPAMKASPNAKKRPRAALNLTSTPGTSASSFLASTVPGGRKATPAPASSDLIDLSQFDEPRAASSSTRPKAATAAATSSRQDDAMEVDGLEEMSKGWGATSKIRGKK